MSAMGRDAAKQPAASEGRRRLPDGPFARQPSGRPADDQTPSAGLEEALTGLRDLEDKLRSQLEKDKERLQHDRRATLSSQPSGSGSDRSGSSSGASSGPSSKMLHPTISFCSVCPSAAREHLSADWVVHLIDGFESISASWQRTATSSGLHRWCWSQHLKSTTPSTRKHRGRRFACDERDRNHIPTREIIDIFPGADRS